ncbi:MAG: hypothetical protein AVDCRST_MAG55-2127, partial [uncultured Rubrobacteraceae bacterium]
VRPGDPQTHRRGPEAGRPCIGVGQAQQRLGLRENSVVAAV